MSTSPVVRLVRLQLTDVYSEADTRVQRIIRRAAGKKGCQQGPQPGRVVVFGSRAADVEQALREAGVEVVESPVDGAV